MSQNQPIRIQRKRTKGFNLQAQSPDGRPVVSVCRPGKWGNEFRVVPENGRFFVVDGNEVPWGADNGYDSHNEAAAYAVRLFGRGWLEGKVGGGHLNPNELRGKHLACFCALDAPCHADALLKWANQPQLLWHRYDHLMRKAGEWTNAEKTELADLRGLLVDAEIVVESDIF